MCVIRVTRYIFNFVARIHISGTAEASCQIVYAGRIYQVLVLG